MGDHTRVSEHLLYKKERPCSGLLMVGKNILNTLRQVLSIGVQMTYSVDSAGIYVADRPIIHRTDEYDEHGFSALKEMQARHFWYAGRHRFLMYAVRRHIPRGANHSAIDIGGGCGGWVRYAGEHGQDVFSELALADSSRVALVEATDVVPVDTDRFQIDLMDLRWSKRWESVFLLDVIEHLPDDVGAMTQVRDALKPGGLVFVTVPALNVFWSYNDELAHHQRRYSRRDFEQLAIASGLELVDARYFMFLLSPLYWLQRRFMARAKFQDQDKKQLQAEASAVPNVLVNAVLKGVFNAETPLGHRLFFPWGTSLLGVFRRVA